MPFTQVLFHKTNLSLKGMWLIDVDITVVIANPCLTSRYDFVNSGWTITDKRQIQNGHDYILLDGTVDVSMDAGTLSYSYLITRPFTLAPSFNLSWYLTTSINPSSDLAAILPPKTYLICSKILLHLGIWAVVGSDKVSVTLFLEQRISNKKNKIFSLICSWINRWANNREASHLRRHRAHYVVNVMITVKRCE